MRKYYALFLLGVTLPLAGWLFNNQSTVFLTQATKSVEFDIAEPTPEGMGYAMPASGGSAPTSRPRCELTVSPNSVSNTGTIRIDWIHEAYDGEVGLSGLDNWQPISRSYMNSVNGVACVAYCNTSNSACSTANFSDWTGLIKVVIGGAGGTFSQNIIDKTNWLARLSLKVPVAQASGGGGSYTCSGASAQVGYTTVNVGSNGFRDGVFKVALATTYKQAYDGHHSITTASECFDMVAITDASIAEVVPELSPIDNDNIVAVGSDVAVAGLVRNIGTVATDYPSLSGGDGQVRYTIEVDLNDNGSTELTFGGDAELLPPMEANTERAVSALIPAAQVSLGTHRVTLCVNYPQAKRRFDELDYTNNCTAVTFEAVLPDLAAYIYPTEAIIGSRITLTGYALNIGVVDVTDAFNSQFEIRSVSAPTNVMVVSGVRQTDPVLADRGVAINSNAFDIGTRFGSERNLEYRFWADSPDNEVDEPSGLNNVLGDNVGNNDSDWLPLTLVPPDVSAESRMPANPVYDTGVLINFPFRIHNELPILLDVTFTSIAAIDTNGNCGAITSPNDACVDYRTAARQTTSIGPSTYDSVNFTWETNLEGSYRLKVFADNTNVLDESNETNNITGWIPFRVSENIDCIGGCDTIDNCVGPCDNIGNGVEQDVFITANPIVVRKGQPVELGWDITNRNPVTCNILINDVTMLLNPVPTRTGNVSHTPQLRTQYKLDCAADGAYVRSQDTVDVNVLPSLYES